MFFRFILGCFLCKSEKDQNHPHTVGKRQVPPRFGIKKLVMLCVIAKHRVQGLTTYAFLSVSILKQLFA